MTRPKPTIAPMAFEEARPGDTIIVRTLERRGQTTFITDTLGVVTELHNDVPAFMYRPQWVRCFPDGAWNLGRDLPIGNDIEAYVPNPHVHLYRVLSQT